MAKQAVVKHGAGACRGRMPGARPSLFAMIPMIQVRSIVPRRNPDNATTPMNTPGAASALLLELRGTKRYRNASAAGSRMRARATRRGAGNHDQCGGPGQEHCHPSQRCLVGWKKYALLTQPSKPVECSARILLRITAASSWPASAAGRSQGSAPSHLCTWNRTAPNRARRPRQADLLRREPAAHPRPTHLPVR